MSTGNGSPPKSEEPAQEYVTVTLGDGNTVEIPKKEIVFENVDFSDELQGVTVEPRDQTNHFPGDENGNLPAITGSSTNVRRNSPPMPEVDVSSEIQTMPDDTTISTMSMMMTDPAAELPLDMEDKDTRYGKDYSRRWKERKDKSKEELVTKGSKAVEIWRLKVRSRKLAIQAVINWKQYVDKCKEDRRQVGIAILKKARERKKRQQLQGTEATDQTSPDKNSEVGSSKETMKASEEEAKPPEKETAVTPEDGTGEKDMISEPKEGTVLRKTSQDLKAAIKKVQPKVSMMRRKDAPPILSLPGDPDRKKKIEAARKVAAATKESVKKEGEAAKKEPAGNKKTVAGDGGGPDPDPGGDGSGDGDKKKKGDEDEKKEGDGAAKKAKATKEGVPQEMAGRIILACKRGDWMSVEALIKQSKTEGLDTRLVTEHLGWSPLHFAAKDNRVTIVDMLIEAGYPVNCKARDGTIPLHLACLYAREDTIRMLLLRGADPMVTGGVSLVFVLTLVHSFNTSLFSQTPLLLPFLCIAPVDFGSSFHALQSCSFNHCLFVKVHHLLCFRTHPVTSRDGDKQAICVV